MAIRGRTCWYALLSGATFLAVDAAYVELMQRQGTVPLSYPALVFEVLLLALAASAVVAAVLLEPRLRLALLSFAVIAGGLFGLISMFSIGIGVLVGSALAAGALALSLRGMPGGNIALAAGAGLVFAIAALGAVFLPSMSTRVTCMNGGASVSGGWAAAGGLSNGSGSISGGPDGTVTGSGTENGKAYSFTCKNGKLVEFRQAR